MASMFPVAASAGSSLLAFCADIYAYNVSRQAGGGRVHGRHERLHRDLVLTPCVQKSGNAGADGPPMSSLGYGALPALGGSAWDLARKEWIGLKGKPGSIRSGAQCCPCLWPGECAAASAVRNSAADCHYVAGGQRQSPSGPPAAGGVGWGDTEGSPRTAAPFDHGARAVPHPATPTGHHLGINWESVAGGVLR